MEFQGGQSQITKASVCPVSAWVCATRRAAGRGAVSHLQGHCRARGPQPAAPGARRARARVARPGFAAQRWGQRSAGWGCGGKSCGVNTPAEPISGRVVCVGFFYLGAAYRTLGRKQRPRLAPPALGSCLVCPVQGYWELPLQRSVAVRPQRLVKAAPELGFREVDETGEVRPLSRNVPGRSPALPWGWRGSAPGTEEPLGRAGGLHARPPARRWLRAVCAKDHPLPPRRAAVRCLPAPPGRAVAAASDCLQQSLNTFLI